MSRSTPGQSFSRRLAECASCHRKVAGYTCYGFSSPLSIEWERSSYATFQPFGSTFLQQGQPAHGVFLVCEGNVKLRYERHGVSLITRIARAGELLGVREVLTETSYRYYAEALEPCALRFMPAAAFHDLMNRHPTLCDSVLQQLTNESDTSDRLRAIAMMDDVKLRVASFVLEFCEQRGRETPAGVRFTLDISHREIGQMIGVSRETVSRKLSELRRAGLLVTKGQTFVVPDLAALEAYCRGRRDEPAQSR